MDKARHLPAPMPMSSAPTDGSPIILLHHSLSVGWYECATCSWRTALGDVEPSGWYPIEGEATKARLAVATRGYRLFYQSGITCPGCSGSSFHIGRSSAECAGCGVALPFTSDPTANAMEVVHG